VALKGGFYKVKFSGDVSTWMRTFAQWYEADFPGKPKARPGAFGTPLHFYIGWILRLTLPVVQQRLEDQGRTADLREVLAIRLAWENDSPGANVARYDYADFLADRMGWEQLETLLLQVRELARQELSS
jgi:hypothetical protein